VLDERLDLVLDGAPLPGTPTEVSVAHGGRVHLIDVLPGSLQVSFEATVRPAPSPEATPSATLDEEALVAMRQSRYCPSDEMTGFAAREIGSDPTPEAIASWVFERLRYAPGTSMPSHTAIDTLLTSEGVCRDYAHLVIALCRAVGIPARLVSVYAPGLTPMDFHAVAEVRTAAGWQILDGTRLAPRATLLRIATGRDAADTAFASTIRGDVELRSAEVWATTDGDLPYDDHLTPVRLG
jgi:transglutaminase-like putative cysteine protease